MQVKFIYISWHRFLLLLVLALIVFYNYYGEYCALCEGYGWDGCSYYKGIVLNGWDEYVSDSISYYHTHRMLPFLVIHMLIRVLSLSFTPVHVMLVSATVNVVLLGGSVFLFFCISSRLGWRKNGESLAFAFCFFNYHVLKFMGYCPVMTDMPTFFLCWLIAYAFFFSKKWLMAICGIIAMIVFPLLSLVAFILLMFRTKIGTYQANKIDERCNLFISIFFVLWLPAAFSLYVIYRVSVKHVSTFQEIFIARPSYGILLTVLALVFYVLFYSIAVKYLKVNWHVILRDYLMKSEFLHLIVGLAIFFILYELPTTYGFRGPFSLVNELAQICQFPATDILIFIETHFLYLGIGFAFMIVFWKEACHEVKSLNLGYYLLLLLSLFFLSDIETRKVICFYLLLLIPLMNVIDKLKISGNMVCFVVFWQLVTSFFWLPVNVSGITHDFETYQVGVYMGWPSQRYYMFQGPWQSHEVYWVTFAVEIIVIIYLYRWKYRLLS